jgi:hypothetical protein
MTHVTRDAARVLISNWMLAKKSSPDRTACDHLVPPSTGPRTQSPRTTKAPARLDVRGRSTLGPQIFRAWPATPAFGSPRPTDTCTRPSTSSPHARPTCTSVNDRPSPVWPDITLGWPLSPVTNLRPFRAPRSPIWDDANDTGLGHSNPQGQQRRTSIGCVRRSDRPRGRWIGSVK